MSWRCWPRACTAAPRCSSAHTTGKKHFIALERAYHGSSSTGTGLTALPVNHNQRVIEGLRERNIGFEKYFSCIVIKSSFVKTHGPIEKLFPSARGLILVCDQR